MGFATQMGRNRFAREKSVIGPALGFPFYTYLIVRCGGQKTKQ
jgi:hypothetical protein